MYTSLAVVQTMAQMLSAETNGKKHQAAMLKARKATLRWQMATPAFRLRTVLQPGLSTALTATLECKGAGELPALEQRVARGAAPFASAKRPLKVRLWTDNISRALFD